MLSDSMDAWFDDEADEAELADSAVPMCATDDTDEMGRRSHIEKEDESSTRSDDEPEAAH